MASSPARRRSIDGETVRSLVNRQMNQSGSDCYFYASTMLLFYHEGVRHRLNENCGSDASNPIVAWFLNSIQSSQICPNIPRTIEEAYNYLIWRMYVSLRDEEERPYGRTQFNTPVTHDHVFTHGEGGFAEIMVHALIWKVLESCGYENAWIPITNNVMTTVVCDWRLERLQRERNNLHNLTFYCRDGVYARSIGSEVASAFSTCDINKPVIYNINTYRDETVDALHFGFNLFQTFDEFRNFVGFIDVYFAEVQRQLKNNRGFEEELSSMSRVEQFFNHYLEYEFVENDEANAFLLNVCLNFSGAAPDSVPHVVLLVNQHGRWGIFDGNWGVLETIEEWHAGYAAPRPHINATPRLRLATVTAVLMPESYRNMRRF